MTKSAKYLSGLDADQRRAVLLSTPKNKTSRDRPLIIKAGPGAGKTHLLASCVAHSISNGIPASKILVLAFGRKAAEELRQRLGGLRRVGVDCGDVTCTTFHAFALRIIRKFHAACDLTSSFTVAAGEDAGKLLSEARKRLSPVQREQLPPISDIKRLFSCKVNSHIKLATAIENFLPQYVSATRPLRAFYREYNRLKRDNNVIDFDDVLRFCLKFLRKNHIGDEIQKRYVRILVDEYQDTSRIQALIIRRLRPSGQGVTLVGDPRQAIFSFRGANAKSMKQARHLFEESAATVVLKTNYRSRRRTVLACNALMTSYGAPMTAKLPKGKRPALRMVLDGPNQARLVARAIKRSAHSGVPLHEQVVLVRTMIEAELLEEELDRIGIPFVKHGGDTKSRSQAMSAFTRAVRWLVNPADSFSGLSTLALIPGISAVRAIAIYNAVKCCGLGKLDRLPKMPTKGRSSLNRIADLARQVDRSSAPTKKTVKDIAAWLRTTLACELTQTDETLLVQAALKLADWRDFLDFIAHSLVDTDDDRPDDRLTISTIHAAKGREWEIVRILNVVAGQIPYQFSSRATVEEERRILFVAMSRAKSQLEMYVPTHIAIRGRYNSDVSISPFISSEIERCCKIG